MERSRRNMFFFFPLLLLSLRAAASGNTDDAAPESSSSSSSSSSINSSAAVYLRGEYEHCASRAPAWARASPNPVHAWILSRATLEQAVSHLVRKGADILGTPILGTPILGTTVAAVAPPVTAAAVASAQEQPRVCRNQEAAASVVSTSLEGTCTAWTTRSTTSGSEEMIAFPILTAEFGRRLRPRPWPELFAGPLVLESGTGCGFDGLDGFGGAGSSSSPSNNKSVPEGSVPEGAVVLVARGGCSFEAKARAAERAGAKGLLVANFPAEPTLMPMSAAPSNQSAPPLPRGYAAMLHGADALRLRSAGATRVECALDVETKWEKAYEKWQELIAVDYRQHQAILTSSSSSSSSTSSSSTTTTTSSSSSSTSTRNSTSTSTSTPAHDPELETLVDGLRQRAYAPVYQLIAPHLSRMLAAFASSSSSSSSSSLPLSPPPAAASSSADVHVAVLVFYGRRRLFQITHLYLEANLRRNGGVVDEVRLVPNTADPEDLKYMRRLLDAHPDWYRLSRETGSSDVWERESGLYGRFYSEVATPVRGTATGITTGTAAPPRRMVVVKMDDDIVFVAPGAFEALVDAKIQASSSSNDAPLFVSANVVNHPRLSHRHQTAGLIRPHRVASRHAAPDTTYRAAVPPEGDSYSAHPCPFSDDPFGRAQLGDWRCAAAIHESFLADVERGPSAVRRWSTATAHLEPGATGKSCGGGSPSVASAQRAQRCVDAFLPTRPGGKTSSAGGGGGGGGGSGTRSAATTTTRWSINAFAFEAADFAAINSTALAAQFLIDDEKFLTETLPSLLGRRSVVAADCLMVHYSYRMQMNGWCGEKPPTGPPAANRSSGGSTPCNESDYGGLAWHVGDSILERYLAIAVATWSAALSSSSGGASNPNLPLIVVDGE